jgi:Uma2 family endonuclease
MTAAGTSSRPFVPGTTGWTASDLEDPEIERLWFAGHYEIISGVLTSMPPAYFPGTTSLLKLVFQLTAHAEKTRTPGQFGAEVDIVIDDDRIVRADAIWLTPADWQRQRDAVALAGRTDPGRTRILVPPTLVIESVSPRHELHDERTKRQWYADFAIPNYWILDGFAKSLKCLVRDEDDYRTDAEGRVNDVVRSSLFPGLSIELQTLWFQE